MTIRYIQKKACISECGNYRYWLLRVWEKNKPILVWIMCNPSKADAEKDDATIRRCVTFSKAWGYGGIRVLNLFAYRSTNPKGLLKAFDPVGPKNDKILTALTRYRTVVCAWGANGQLYNRAERVLQILDPRRRHCLGLTAEGQPKHPLRLRKDTELKPLLRLVS